MRGRHIAAALIIGLALTTIVVGGLTPPAAGEIAPEFGLTDIDTGQALSLSELQGKWVLLDFWATWCGPCRMAMERELNPLWQNFGHRSDEWTMISIGSSTESPTEQRQFVDNQGYDWTFLHDPTGATFDAYGVEFIPTLVLINPEGQIEAINGSVGSWDRFLEMLQSGQPSAPSNS